MVTFTRIKALMWADMLAEYVMWLMMTYLTNVWKLNFTHAAAAIINIWAGVAFIMPIGFAYLVDTFVGDYAMLVGVQYFLQHCTCSAYKPECIGLAQKILYYTALALIAVGISGHAVSLNSFYTDHITDYRVSLGISAVLIIPIIGDVVLPIINPWSILFGLPAICTVVATLLFSTGSCSYMIKLPQGNPLTTVFRVFVASASKIWHQCPQNASELNEYSSINRSVIPHSNGLRFLYKAAIVLPTLSREEQEKNRWRLCSVTEVEETKIVIRMVPVCMSTIFFGVVISIGKTYFIVQASHMNRKLGHSTVPLPLFLMFNVLINYDFAKNTLTALYFKIQNYFLGSGSKRYGPPTGIGVAMVFSVLCCITAAKVETQRHNAIRSHGLLDKPDEKIPMSIFWLLPQFLLLGMVDGISERSIDKFIVTPWDAV
ncbi:protein NRT1/ PTR FAMILY 5.5-like [Cornus florida]|uniref:protein NRT1/ PTR FAMILY 5.5-like n=1 Tax=Cornus florida TaxID=4283 RepID=UPI00289C52C3|nr:protein NRT1/ PTR FAMILY 5.5-like [Cornus florida]